MSMYSIVNSDTTIEISSSHDFIVVNGVRYYLDEDLKSGQYRVSIIDVVVHTTIPARIYQVFSYNELIGQSAPLIVVSRDSSSAPLSITTPQAIKPVPYSQPEPVMSNHHLFTRPEIRAKLIQIYGEPVTEADHRRIQRLVEQCHRRIPTFKIDHALHKSIHSGDE